MRPAEVPNQPSEKERDALNYHEEKVREAVQRCEGPLQVRLSRRPRVPRPSPTAIATIGVLVAIAVIGWIYFTPADG